MTRVLRRSLAWGGIFAAALLLVAGSVGWSVAGPPGLWAAIAADVAALLFLGLTTVSMLVAARVAERRGGTAFFAIFAGSWFVKMVLFLVLIIALRDAAWMDPAVFGVTLIVMVLGLLVVDAVAMIRTRVPVIDEPGKNFDGS